MDENILELTTSVSELAETRSWQAIKELIKDKAPQDIAILMEDLDEKQMPPVFRLLPKELAAETFVEMSADQQELLIKGFSDAELKDVISELYVDDAADIVEEMPANLVKRILASADSDTRKAINEILEYPENSAGSIMTTEYIRLDRSLTVEDAFKRIKRVGVDKETIYTCYVTENDRTLLGYTSIKELLIADDDDIIADIMDPNVISVMTTDDQENVARALSHYNFIALPVVDKENRLVGIVTIDDAMDVMEEEATEDIEKMAAIMASDDKPYLRMDILEIWKARIPWLLFLMISATVAEIVITGFKGTLSTFWVLAAFIPMLMGTGGNSGSQSAVTVVRALTLEEIDTSDIWEIIKKELAVAVACGLTLAVVAFGKIFLINRLLMGNSDVSVTVDVVVCVALFLTVVVAKLFGCVLPIIAKKLKLDPAIMASPLITTLIDVTSLLIYFVIAEKILR